MDKSCIRVKYRAIRKNIKNKLDLDHKIKHRFLEYIGDCTGKVIAGYSPIDGEVDVVNIMEYYSNLGNKIAIPKMHEGKILFTDRNNKNKTLSDAFYYNHCDEILSPDIIIVPCVAFNSDLYRVGFGGGFYDKAIHHLRANKSDVKFIGIAYQAQYCSEIPVEKHDQKLDCVITDSK